MKDATETLLRLIEDAHKVVAFTGAGSTDFQRAASESLRSAPGEAYYEVRDGLKSAQLRALNDVSFELRPGEALASTVPTRTVPHPRGPDVGTTSHDRPERRAAPPG